MLQHQFIFPLLLYYSHTTITFFTVYTKLEEMALLASKDLRTAKQKLPPVGLDLVSGLGVQCLTI